RRGAKGVARRSPSGSRVDERRTIPLESIVARDDSQPFDLSDGDDQAIERIVVMFREGTDRGGMLVRDRKRPEYSLSHGLGRPARVEVADNLPFPGPASGHAARPVGERDETRARFSVARDDDFFALRGPLDELGESRLGGGDVDRFPHEVST